MKPAPKAITPVSSSFSLLSKNEREKFKVGAITVSADKGTAEVAVNDYGQIYIKGGKNVSVTSDIINNQDSRITMEDSEISSIYTGFGKDVIELHNCQFKEGWKGTKLGESSIRLRGSNNVLYVSGDLKGSVYAQQDQINGKEKADKIFVNGTNYATIHVDKDDIVKIKNGNKGRIEHIVIMPIVY